LAGCIIGTMESIDAIARSEHGIRTRLRVHIDDGAGKACKKFVKRAICPRRLVAGKRVIVYLG
jgi:hypothetical protein